MSQEFASLPVVATTLVRRKEAFLGFCMFRFSMILGLLVTFTVNPTAAQQPSPAQRDAIRSACRSDFIANCSGIQPGGKEAFACLQGKETKLSASCKTAINAVALKPEVPVTLAPAAPDAAAQSGNSVAKPSPKTKEAETQEDQIKRVRQACSLNDFMAHCSWIASSSPELLLCLKANAAGLSPPCQTAIQSLPAVATPAAVETPQAETARPEPAPAKELRANAPTPSGQGAAQKPTPQQKSAVRAACRSDFKSHCSGVQPGGAEALRCLQRNGGQLSAACKSAVAAIGKGVPAAFAPLGPIPPMHSRKMLAILALCRTDQETLCAGIPPGGGRIISCLAENTPRLSPGCYEGLARGLR